MSSLVLSAVTLLVLILGTLLLRLAIGVWLRRAIGEGAPGLRPEPVRIIAAAGDEVEPPEAEERGVAKILPTLRKAA